LSGLVKKFIIADALLGIIVPVMRDPTAYSRAGVIGAVYGAAIWLYVEFGGYTDIAIGVSRLLGYRIMENFNRPFLKKNIALYWRNWHISVYSWIRDYFYFPLFVYRGTPFKIYAGIFCTMMVFMLWHAGTVNFLLAGIYNSVGLIVWKFFQDVKDRNDAIRQLFSFSFLDPLGTLVTFSYVSFGIGITFMGGDVNNIHAILVKIFHG